MKNPQLLHQEKGTITVTVKVIDSEIKKKMYEYSITFLGNKCRNRGGTLGKYDTLIKRIID